MNRSPVRPRRAYVMTFCAFGMAALAIVILIGWGVTPLTAVLIAALLACPVAGYYAWRASRHAEREIDALRSVRKGP